MASFSDWLKVFEVNIHDVIKDIAEKSEVKQSIIDYNQEQLSQGIDSLGQRIETIASQEQNSGYPYSKYTVKIRGSEGLQVNNVDLKVTGQLWDSMEVEVANEGMIVNADTNKSGGDVMDNFESRFDFWGLTKKNKKGFAIWVLSDYLKPALLKFFTTAKTSL